MFTIDKSTDVEQLEVRYSGRRDKLPRCYRGLVDMANDHMMYAEKGEDEDRHVSWRVEAPHTSRGWTVD